MIPLVNVAANDFFYTDWLHGYKREAAIYQNKFVPFPNIEVKQPVTTR